MEGLLISAVVVIVFICFISFLKHKAKESDSQLHIEAPRLAASNLTGTAPTTAPTESGIADFSMLPREFIVLDLETTGLSPERDEIIEFGAIRVTLDSQTLPMFQSLVKPERRIPKHITEINGISQEMVDNDGRPLREVLTEFLEFIEDLPLVTFNAEFDMGFLQSAANKHGLAINNRYTCALKLARRAWPGLPSYRLTDLAKMGNLDDDDTHRALGDCKRTVIVFTSSASIIGKPIRWSKLRAEMLARN